MNQQLVVEVPVGALSVDGSPRTSGLNPDHVEALATTNEELPPIIVHRSTMRVIDGLHRLKAAKRRGKKTIAVRFFDGGTDDAFVLAVQANVIHGLPLSLAERKQAAERIIKMHPQWSTNRIAKTAGISPGKVADIRRMILGESGPDDFRIGRDGKVRRINAAEGRRIAIELIAKNPEMTLRPIARAAGISPETVRSLRNRLRQGEKQLESENSLGIQSTTPQLPGGPVRLAETRDRGQPPADLERLKADPALRFSAAGRDLLRLLHVHGITIEEWKRLIDSIPSHSRGVVAQLARFCAELWAEFARNVEVRGRLSGMGGRVQVPASNGWTTCGTFVSIRPRITETFELSTPTNVFQGGQQGGYYLDRPP